MDDAKKYRNYLTDLILLFRESASEHCPEGDDSYNDGRRMAYFEILSLMKSQALAFDIELPKLEPLDILRTAAQTEFVADRSAESE